MPLPFKPTVLSSDAAATLFRFDLDDREDCAESDGMAYHAALR
jgi:hypothetical protein